MYFRYMSEQIYKIKLIWSTTKAKQKKKKNAFLKANIHSDFNKFIKLPCIHLVTFKRDIFSWNYLGI